MFSPLSTLSADEFPRNYAKIAKVHRLMLQDLARNQAYKDAIFNNKNLLQGKTVLDVGAGTGILSIFCAQAGATKIYAVEASDIYKITEEIVKENHLENVIEVIHNKIEDVSLPGDVKVDVIVSEWMGFYLLHEGMLDSVIFARDKFLKDDGYMFPESATIFCAPCSIPDFYDFWADVSGISMKCLGDRYREQKSEKPEILNVASIDLLSDGTSICWLDLKNMTTDEVNAIYYQNVVAAKRSGRYQGLCLWFTVDFPSGSNQRVTLSTAPSEISTHWKQTVVVLPQELVVEEGSPIAFEITLQRSEENARRYNIQITMLDSEEATHPEPCDCHMTKCIIIKKMLENYEQNENKTDD